MEITRPRSQARLILLKARYERPYALTRVCTIVCHRASSQQHTSSPRGLAANRVAHIKGRARTARPPTKARSESYKAVCSGCKYVCVGAFVSESIHSTIERITACVTVIFSCSKVPGFCGILLRDWQSLGSRTFYLSLILCPIIQ